MPPIEAIEATVERFLRTEARRAIVARWLSPKTVANRADHFVADDRELIVGQEVGDRDNAVTAKRIDPFAIA